MAKVSDEAKGRADADAEAGAEKEAEAEAGAEAEASLSSASSIWIYLSSAFFLNETKLTARCFSKPAFSISIHASSWLVEVWLAGNKMQCVEHLCAVS